MRDEYQGRLYERAQDIVATIPGVTIGYIGNLEVGRDDREWYIFLPHPGRIGKAEDRLGGYSTEDRWKLVTLARTLKIGFDLAA